MITRLKAEVSLIARAGRKMDLVGMNISATGTNESLNDPLGMALLGMGLNVADLASVTDTDLAAIEDIPQFLDRAELRLLETIAGNIDLVNITTGPRSEALSDLSKQVEAAITRLTKKIEKQYGSGVGSLQPGVVTLDFAEKYDATSDTP